MRKHFQFRHFLRLPNRYGLHRNPHLLSHYLPIDHIGLLHDGMGGYIDDASR